MLLEKHAGVSARPELTLIGINKLTLTFIVVQIGVFSRIVEKSPYYCHLTR